MSKLSKTIVSILIVVVFLVLHAIVFGVRQSQGARTSGVLGLILFGGMIYAIRVIWKKTSPEAKKSQIQQHKIILRLYPKQQHLNIIMNPFTID